MRKRARQLGTALATVVVGASLLGCAAGDARVDPKLKSGLSTVAVHPLEAPPLEVPNHFLLAAEMAGEYRDLGEVGLLVGGIVVASNSESLAKRAQLLESYADLLESDSVWQPTSVVAEKVVLQLKSRTDYEVRTLLPMTRLYVDREDVGLDLYGPVRSWYNGDTPAEASLSAKSDLVIEVGIWNYAFVQNVLGIAVVLKAVDPATGTVLGRARAWDTPPVDAAEIMFANDAGRFKAVFTETVDRLTAQDLSQLGF